MSGLIFSISALSSVPDICGIARSVRIRSNWSGSDLNFSRAFALLFSAITSALLVFASPDDHIMIFILGTLSEFGAGIMPVLFFAMLGDCADFSEWKNGRRATGLIFSAGTFAFKFGGGIAGAIIGWVLAAYNYNGMDETTIAGAIPGIKMLMSWLPALILVGIGVIALLFYPLTDKKIETINEELSARKTLVSS